MAQPSAGTTQSPTQTLNSAGTTQSQADQQTLANAKSEARLKMDFLSGQQSGLGSMLQVSCLSG